MSFFVVISLMLAPVTDPELLLRLNESSSAPPEGFVVDPLTCPDRKAKCATPNRFDRFNPPNPLGPAFLMISNGQTIRTIPYKTMKACERARRYVSGPPAGSPAPGGGIYGPPAVIYACVPR